MAGPFDYKAKIVLLRWQPIHVSSFRDSPGQSRVPTEIDGKLNMLRGCRVHDEWRISSIVARIIRVGKTGVIAELIGH